MLKRILFAVMFTAVLSASALSVRQLGTGTHAVLACGSACSRSNLNCQKPCLCFGLFNGNTRRLPAGRPGACADQMS